MEQQTPQTAIGNGARAGEALSVRRLFTQPGVHPFESVDWELRDARIGSVFEQKGVEFPSTWSQNATNIVAQKYFRGPARLARSRALGQADGRARRRHDRRLGPPARATSRRSRTATASRPS
jgi:ribonucleoside-diphosphate reductase alpha chain